MLKAIYKESCLGSSNYLGMEAFERFLWQIEGLPDWVQKSIQTICLLVCVYSGRALFSIYCLWDNTGVMWHWVSIQLLPSLCDGHSLFYKLNADWCFQYRATDRMRFYDDIPTVWGCFAIIPQLGPVSHSCSRLNCFTHNKCSIGYTLKAIRIGNSSWIVLLEVQLNNR